MQKKVLKDKHLKFALGAARLDAIWFGALERTQGEEYDGFSGEFEWTGVPELNRYNGRVTPSFKIKGARRLPPEV